MAGSGALNGDRALRVVVDTRELDCEPVGTVLRKRLHRVGPAESGQVTSLVRCLPQASVPEHDHPEGEGARPSGGVGPAPRSPR